MKKNNKGQSLIDVIFSVGIIVLVLTGVVTLVVSTVKVKRMAFERQKAVELSQKIVETEIKKTKDDPLAFWSLPKNEINSTDNNFSGYEYKINYDCVINGLSNDKCNVIFTVNWGDNQTLSVERLFTRRGI